MSIAPRKLRRLIRKEQEQTLRRFRKQKNRNLLAEPGPYPYVVVLDHLKPSYNVGKIFRSADAFGAHEVHLVGIDFFNPAPAMGSFKWVPARFHNTAETCIDELMTRGYSLFTLEPDADIDMTAIPLPERSAFIFGHEEFGLSFDPADFPGVRSVKIPQFGRVQSLNVSIAASVVMYEYIRQHGLNVQGTGVGGSGRCGG